MKKTLLAAALVTGLAGVAHAENSVTLYGVVDGGYGFEQTETTVRTKVPAGLNENGQYTRYVPFNNSVKERNIGFQGGVANGNRWGLKGIEDLGNGTSAIFKLESGFDLGNGRSSQDDRLFGRSAIIGLTGDDWGTLTLGRQTNVADAFVASVDPFHTDFGLAGAHNSFGDSLTHRYDAVAKFISPNTNGFQFGLGLTADSETTKEEHDYFLNNQYTNDYLRYAVGNEDSRLDRTTYGVTTGLGYTYGPLYLAASYDFIWARNESENSHGFKSKDTSKTHAWNVGLTYDFDFVKLHMLYGQQHGGSFAALRDEDGNIGDSLFNPLNGGRMVTHTDDFGNVVGGVDPLAEGYRTQAWMLGLSAPVTERGTIMFSYQGNEQKNGNSEANWFNGVQLHDSEQKTKGHIFSLGYEHSVSKRTAVYAVGSYGWSKNTYKDVAGTEEKTKAIFGAVGLKHRF